MYSIPAQLLYFDPRLCTQFFDDFVVEDGGSTSSIICTPNFKRIISGTGSGVQQTASATQARTLGVMRMFTGSTASGYAMMCGSNILPPNGPIREEWRVNVSQLSDAVDEFAVYVGMGDDVEFGNPVESGICFIYDRTISVNWLLYCRDFLVGASEIKNSGVPVVAGQWYKLLFETSPDNQFSNFYIDGVFVGSIAGKNPTLTEAVRAAMATIQKNVGLASRSLEADYCNFQQVFNVSR
jgi:hypothetical protein